MNEMKPILYRWRLTKCTRVKRFTFRKVSAKICNFRVPIYKGVPLTRMKWHPSFNDGGLPSVREWKVSLFEKWVLKYATIGCSFIKGFPSHQWNEIHPLTTTGSQIYACDDSWPSVRLWKYSLSEKCVLKYATWGFPFIRGFPSHEWKETLH